MAIEPAELSGWVTEGATAYVYHCGTSASYNSATQVTIEKITKLHVIAGGEKYSRRDLRSIKRQTSFQIANELAAPDDYRVRGALRSAAIRSAVSELRDVIRNARLFGDDPEHLIDQVRQILTTAIEARDGLERIVSQKDSPA